MKKQEAGLPQWLDRKTGAQVMAAELVRHRQYLYELKKLPGAKFDPVQMMALDYIYFRRVHSDNFTLEGMREWECRKPGDRDFDYRTHDTMGSRVYWPSVKMDERCLLPMQNMCPKVVSTYKELMKRCHDFAENLTEPFVIDDTKEVFFVRPAEQMIAQVHYRVMKTKNDSFKQETLRLFVEAIMGIKRFSESGHVNTGHIAQVWLDAVMSVIYHAPLFGLAGRAVATEYGELSVDDALKAYGVACSLSGEHLRLLPQSRVIVTEHEYSWASLNACDSINSKPIYQYKNPYCDIAVEKFMEVTGMSTQSGHTQLEGFNAYLARLLFQDNRRYDFAHFWVDSDMPVYPLRYTDVDANAIFVSTGMYKAMDAQYNGQPPEGFDAVEMLNFYASGVSTLVHKPMPEEQKQAAKSRLERLGRCVTVEESRQGIAADSELSALPAITRIVAQMEKGPHFGAASGTLRDTILATSL